MSASQAAEVQGAESRPAGAARIVVVVADGLRADVAAQAMGYLGALLEAGRASRTELKSGLPSLSRPLYATLITGQWHERAPDRHGAGASHPALACRWL